MIRVRVRVFRSRYFQYSGGFNQRATAIQFVELTEDQLYIMHSNHAVLIDVSASSVGLLLGLVREGRWEELPERPQLNPNWAYVFDPTEDVSHQMRVMAGAGDSADLALARSRNLLLSYRERSNPR